MLAASLQCFIFSNQPKDGTQPESQKYQKSVGVIYITVYDNEEDYMENRYAGAIAKVESEGSLEAVLKIPYGKYAVTIFHDVNEDEELNTNFIGIPKEPYGFSNNPKSSFGPPSFEQSLFEFSEDGQRIEIELG
jgi:uncharacterized protein (DUF2141 family)